MPARSAQSLAEVSDAVGGAAHSGFRGALSRGSEALIVKNTCRSGEVIRYAGDVVVFGDVNPGAEIIAGGDIVVLGRLAGHGSRRRGRRLESYHSCIEFGIAPPADRFLCGGKVPESKEGPGRRQGRQSPNCLPAPAPPFMWRPLNGDAKSTVEEFLMKGKTIVVTSGKGGVGKTTSTANIGARPGPAGAIG